MNLLPLAMSLALLFQSGDYRPRVVVSGLELLRPEDREQVERAVVIVRMERVRD